MTVPHIPWKRMLVDDLKHYYETTTEEYTQKMKDFIITLVHLVEDGKILAFKSLEGSIVYQHNPLYVVEDNR